MTLEATMSQRCNVEGCTRPSARSGLCWGHLKRRQRRLPVDEPLKPPGSRPRENLLEAVAVLYEADPLDKPGYRKAWDRFRSAMRRYVLTPKPHTRRPKPL